MKKILFFTMLFLLVLGNAVSAHSLESTANSNSAAPTSTKSKNDGLNILVNGVEVVSPSNHLMPNGKVYVAVEDFASLFNQEITLSKDKTSVEFNGQTISNIHMIKGVPTAWIRDLANAVGADNISWDAENQEVYVLVVPEGVIQLEDGFVVPAMGEHWADPKYLPEGPIFGVYQGKLIFIEYMISQEDFVNGVNHRNLTGIEGIPTPSVVQSDIEYQATGHPGFEIPHFDIHMYYISDEDQHAIK